MICKWSGSKIATEYWMASERERQSPLDLIIIFDQIPIIFQIVTFLYNSPPGNDIDKLGIASRFNTIISQIKIIVAVFYYFQLYIIVVYKSIYLKAQK